MNRKLTTHIFLLICNMVYFDFIDLSGDEKINLSWRLFKIYFKLRFEFLQIN